MKLFIGCLSISVVAFTLQLKAGNPEASYKFSKNKSSHYYSYYITTDALSLFNSAISKTDNTFIFSGEVCKDHMYGFKINFTSIKNGFTNNYSKGFLIKPEFRWYLSGDDCSAFHAGIYCSFLNSSTQIGDKKSNDEYIYFKESLFEAGISGGYKVLINERWVINPAAYAGLSNRYNYQIIESRNTGQYFTTAELMINVVLEIGYRF
jgi:hypothetical protein